jgi:putative SOS response-associated peptidase YedK
MCGRYSNAKALKKLAQKARVVEPLGLFAPRHNIAPTQLAPVIFQEQSGPVMKLMRWGFPTRGARGGGAGPLLINARAETIATKPAFQRAFQERRCLVPADGFYEWQERAGQRQPFRITLASGEPFCFAGLWEPPPGAGTPEPPGHLENAVATFTIITTAANAAMSPLHTRMPVMVGPEDYAIWLADDSFATVLANPFAAPLKIHPVSPLVNSPANDDPRCLEPVPLERDLFERPWWSAG